jgi:hypothetical protein
MQKYIHLINLIKNFPTIPTNTSLQNLASMQRVSFRTTPVPSAFANSPVYQPASQPRTSLSEIGENN